MGLRRPCRQLPRALGLHGISRGGLAFGDVPLAGIIGISTARISRATTWWSLIIIATAAATWTLVTGSVSDSPTDPGSQPEPTWSLHEVNEAHERGKAEGTAKE